MGKERLEEIADPEIAMQRAINTYREKGYSEEWITQRIRTIETRKELTAEWNRVGVNEGIEYAILTDDISKAWSGMSTKEYKQYKGLKFEESRDVAKRGGNIAGNARQELEEVTGKSVISKKNSKNPELLDE